MQNTHEMIKARFIANGFSDAKAEEMALRNAGKASKAMKSKAQEPNFLGSRESLLPRG